MGGHCYDKVRKTLASCKAATFEPLKIYILKKAKSLCLKTASLSLTKCRLGSRSSRWDTGGGEVGLPSECITFNKDMHCWGLLRLVWQECIENPTKWHVELGSQFKNKGVVSAWTLGGQCKTRLIGLSDKSNLCVHWSRGLEQELLKVSPYITTHITCLLRTNSGLDLRQDPWLRFQDILLSHLNSGGKKRIPSNWWTQQSSIQKTSTRSYRRST